MYDFALVTKQQLEEVGFKIDLQVMDWSTLGQRRVQPKEYDVFTTGMGNFYDPTHHIYLTSSWPGWTHDEDILSLQSELARETDPKKRMAAPALLAREPETVLHFTRAVYRTQRWLAGRAAGEIATVVAPEYSEVSPPVLEAAIARYQRQDTWAHDPLLRRSGYDVLQHILLSGGFIRGYHRYADLVDTAFATQAMAPCRRSLRSISAPGGPPG